jgi:glycosyltransferase involved in cell wall biosynthesis
VTLRVGIDATELRLGAVGGVPRALRLLFEALRDHAPEIEAVAYSPGPIDVPPDVRMNLTGGPASPRRWRQSRALRRELRRVDLFHSPVTAFPRGAGIPVTATVHELPFVADRGAEPLARALAAWVWLSRAMAECAALVAPSEATLRQMRLAHPAIGGKTRVIPHPCPPAVPGAGPDEGYLLHVGRFDRRKRVDELRGLGLPLRLVGPDADGGPVPDERLDALYRRARAVVVASVSEGFGFPVLEALARGVPAIARRGTGAAETGGDACLLAETAEEFRAAYATAGDPAYRARTAREGPARAAAFSARRTAAAYRDLFLDAAHR